MKEPDNGREGQIVTVDAGKLSQGLKTAFEGVSMIFDSIGVDCNLGVSDSVKDTDKTEKAADNPGEEPANKNDVGEGAPEVEQESADAAQEQEPTLEEPSQAPKKESALTIDDVTKVIVQKIRKDRSNNEKIGQILKTFDVGKVSDLPAEKYEAFLTELAAL